MPLEAGLIAYVGLAGIAVGRKGNRGSSTLPPPLTPPMARTAGALLLLVSVLAAMLRFGPALGVVAWTGELCVAGATLVLLMSWRLRWALLLCGPALLAAGILVLV